MKKRALLSVYDKTGIVEFARGLAGLGYEIVSTGGTAAALTAAGINIVGISDVTGYPECLDGRVKTLHPAIHAGILAMRGNAGHMAQLEQLNVVPIDVIAVNLYPFKATISRPDVKLPEAIEQIDIGGPTTLRAAAKNWQDVAVVVDPADYTSTLEGLRSGGLSRDAHFELAVKVFEHTAAYDALIAQYLRRQAGGGHPQLLTLTYELQQSMRYGENPHQSAAFYREPITTGGGLPDAEQLGGKELSYNNINDTNGALDLLKEFDNNICAVAVKHASPCGVAVGATVCEAYTKAFDADPISISGGIVAINETVDVDTAREMVKTFLEIVIAPEFTPEAIEILKTKPNLRILRLPGIKTKHLPGVWDTKKTTGGLLIQDIDTELLNEAELKVVSKRLPTDAEMRAMRFGWAVVKHTKSNAIVLSREDTTVGVGPGQQRRVASIDLAVRYAGDRAAGSVMASDAYLPFVDNVEAAVRAGITAIIQPGGSIRDAEVLAAADAAGIAMVVTGMRHFRH